MFTVFLVLPLFFTGYLTHTFGRKTVLMLTSVLFTSSWLMIAYATSVAWICAGRVISGFCTGLYVVAVPAYVTEIAPQDIRGKLSSGFPFANNFGILVVMSLGLALRWSWLAIAIVVVTVLASCMMVFMPESPDWLVRESRLYEASCALKFFHGKNFNSKEELDKIIKVIRSEKQDNPVTMKDFINPILYKPLLISVAMLLFHTTAGLGPVMAYAVDIFKRARSIDPDIASIVFALVQIIATVACGFIIDNFGRRKLYMLSGAGTSALLFCMSIYSYMLQYHPVNNSAMGYVPLVCLSLIAFIFSIGIGSIPFVMIPEMVSVKYRSTVLSISLVCASIFAFIINKTYNNLRDAIGDYGLYSLFGFFTLLSVVFAYFVLPETKKLSFETISKRFAKSQK